MAKHKTNPRIGLSNNRAVSGGNDRHKKHRRKGLPPPGARPAQPEGIIISLGPADGKVLKDWLTFPVTPESIPITTGAIWNSQMPLQGGETISFGGKSLDTPSFEGRLEPPEYYLVRSGGMNVNEALLEDLEERARISGPVFNLPGSDTRVKMEQGARAGPNYLEADAFVGLLEQIEKEGEVVRLIIGDNFGWNKQAVITDFTWRFEDPDPDTILYSLSFKQYRSMKIHTGKAAEDAPKGVQYTTQGYPKHPDTLESIALKMWGAAYKWQYLRTLNQGVLKNLWWYPDIGSTEKTWRQGGSVGEHIPGRADGSKFGGGASSMPPNMPFRNGITLKMEAVHVGAELNAADAKSAKKHHKHKDN